MSLPRDILLFSIVLMVWAVRIETRGYESSGEVVVAALGFAVVGLAGSVVSSLRAAGPDAGATADADSTE
jgi:putative effector of murein hydrolase